MDDVTPKQTFCPLDENSSRYAPRGYGQAGGSSSHPFDDFFFFLSGRGAPQTFLKRYAPTFFTGLMYGAAMACALWKNGCAILGRLRGDVRRQPKSLSAFAT